MDGRLNIIKRWAALGALVLAFAALGFFLETPVLTEAYLPEAALTPSPTAPPTPTPPPDPATFVVYVSASGTKYHDSATCSNMKTPRALTLLEAAAEGYEPCARCKPPEP
ncbi:MAG: hypothetical protein LBN04_08580 [Oscillospiraceae bacterium]|jgi:endonuclease G|nr:hypothetical protein [Oscillospiraceae bacterium]